MEIYHIAALRDSLMHGQAATQAQLDALAAELRPQKAVLRPRDKDELLPLFTADGEATGACAPRWLCHVLALRHRCAHILLIWKNRVMGDALLLQIRSWHKDDSPGYLDISIGGHMTVTEKQISETAFAEMTQEMNLQIGDLCGEQLLLLGGYSCDEQPRPAENFYNAEWRDVYIGYVKERSFKKIKFLDGEIGGLALVPLLEAQALLQQKTMPMASALQQSLPICLAKILHG